MKTGMVEIRVLIRNDRACPDISLSKSLIYIYNEQVLGNVPEHRLYFFFHFQIYINIVSQIRLVNP